MQTSNDDGSKTPDSVESSDGNKSQTASVKSKLKGFLSALRSKSDKTSTSSNNNNSNSGGFNFGSSDEREFSRASLAASRSRSRSAAGRPVHSKTASVSSSLAGTGRKSQSQSRTNTMANAHNSSADLAGLAHTNPLTGGTVYAEPMPVLTNNFSNTLTTSAVDATDAELIGDEARLRANLRSIQRDFEDIAETQRLRLNENQQPVPSFPLPVSTPSTQPFNSASTANHNGINGNNNNAAINASIGLGLGLRTGAGRKSLVTASTEYTAPPHNHHHSHSQHQLTNHASFPTSHGTQSLRSARSMQSLNTPNADLEYSLLLSQHHPILPSARLTTGDSISISTAPNSTLYNQNVLAISRKVVEDAEKSALAVNLGDGYPDMSSLVVGEGGRLLLPSEIKKLNKN
ncbi:hypothetical protein HK100_005304 [Physocladia obscura]|uniref:Uncharacterized protein n=1 Tax=Physocladia obscura TaxID=109957 RepID=A0AAD5XC01_9FUNG|nr:hypothetical protein HK100_005304 [Physocladia obscura]